MQQKTLLLVGLGDLGGRIAYLAVQQGLEVQGMRRGTNTPPGVTLIQHDAASPWPDLPVHRMMWCFVCHPLVRVWQPISKPISRWRSRRLRHSEIKRPQRMSG